MAQGRRTVLVSGGSGRLAGRVIDLLLEAGTDAVVTTTRTPARLAHLAERGVVVRHADHDDPGSLRSAYDGVDRALIVSTNVTGRRSEQVRAVLAAAADAGVGHVCYTSTLAPKPDPLDRIDNDHFWSEAAIFASGMSWTILRHAMYAEHIYLSLAIAVASGRLLSMMGPFGRSYVTREDCSRADAAGLSSDETDCRIHDITGAELLTQQALAELGTTLTGRPVTVENATPERVREAWIAGGLPARLADSLIRYDHHGAQGVHSVISDAIRRLTGADPERAASFLTRNGRALLPGEDGHAVLVV